jgi:hypothetical protein
MGLIKEPLNVDFVVENRLLTQQEEMQISLYIASQKKYKDESNKNKSRISNKRQKIKVVKN